MVTGLVDNLGGQDEDVSSSRRVNCMLGLVIPALIGCRTVGPGWKMLARAEPQIGYCGNAPIELL